MRVSSLLAAALALTGSGRALARPSAPNVDVSSIPCLDDISILTILPAALSEGSAGAPIQAQSQQAIEELNQKCPGCYDKIVKQTARQILSTPSLLNSIISRLDLLEETEEQSKTTRSLRLPEDSVVRELYGRVGELVEENVREVTKGTEAEDWLDTQADGCVARGLGSIIMSTLVQSGISTAFDLVKWGIQFLVTFFTGGGNKGGSL